MHLCAPYMAWFSCSTHGFRCKKKKKRKTDLTSSPVGVASSVGESLQKIEAAAWNNTASLWLYSFPSVLCTHSVRTFQWNPALQTAVATAVFFWGGVETSAESWHLISKHEKGKYVCFHNFLIISIYFFFASKNSNEISPSAWRNVLNIFLKGNLPHNTIKKKGNKNRGDCVGGGWGLNRKSHLGRDEHI